jgi:hypothetical protein
LAEGCDGEGVVAFCEAFSLIVEEEAMVEVERFGEG